MPEQIIERHRKYGWKPDVPDFRDHQFLAAPGKLEALPPRIDLRKPDVPILDQGDLGSCHDDKTEVLTDFGWKLFSKLLIEDKLATVDPLTKNLKFEKPIRLVRFNYSGEMICGKNQQLDFCVTPDHNMLVRKWDENKRTLRKEFEFVKAKDIGWYSGLMSSVIWKGKKEKSFYSLKEIDHKQKEKRTSRNIYMNDWLEFLGIYIAEGTMLTEEANNHHYKIQLAASKPREQNYIKDLLKRLGVSYCLLKDRITFENKQIYFAMKELGLEGVKAPNKFVPKFIFDLSGIHIKYFLLGHFMGDGSLTGNCNSHYTSSKILCEDLQRLIFLSSNNSYIASRPPRISIMKNGRKIIGRHNEYRISSHTRNLSSIDRRSNITKNFYCGEVFCAEVSTYHTLVTRRNGKILISGNCTANAIAISHFFDQIKQKSEFPFIPSRLFIYYNEREMEGTINSDSGATIRDGIKSIAKQGVCDEKIWPYDVSRYTTKPLDSCYKIALNNQALEYSRVTQTLDQLKGCLALGFPFIFGFAIYDSFESQEVSKTGIVPMPSTNERMLGGHAVICQGYDDSTGRFLVQNSWGQGWGQFGYFTIPYEYLINTDLAADFWVVKVVEVNTKPTEELTFWEKLWEKISGWF